MHRVSAGVLEQYIVDVIQGRLSPSWSPELDTASRCRSAIVRIDIGADQVAMKLKAHAISREAGETVQQGDTVEVRLPMILKRREGAVIIIPQSGGPEPKAQPDKTLIRAIVLARSWAAEIAEGRFSSIKELARSHDLCASHTMRILPLAYLAPDLVTMILEGRQPRTLSLKTLTARPLPLDWNDQRRAIDMIGRGLL